MGLDSVVSITLNYHPRIPHLLKVAREVEEVELIRTMYLEISSVYPHPIMGPLLVRVSESSNALKVYVKSSRVWVPTQPV